MTREEQVQSNAMAILAVCKEIETITNTSDFAHILFGLAFCESSGEWNRPMEELLRVEAAASDTGVWQITPIYKRDVDFYLANQSGWYAETFGDKKPDMDTLDGQSRYARTYCHIYRRKLQPDLSDFWLLHHYGPSMKNRANNVDETNKYLTNYNKGLEVFNALNQVQG